MTRKPQANNALDLAGGSYDVLKDDASPFGLGESCNRVGKHLFLSCHRAPVWRSTLFKPPSYIPLFYADPLLPYV